MEMIVIFPKCSNKMNFIEVKKENQLKNYYKNILVNFNLRMMIDTVNLLMIYFFKMLSFIRMISKRDL